MSFQHFLICHRNVCQPACFPISLLIITFAQILFYTDMGIMHSGISNSKFAFKIGICGCTSSFSVPSPTFGPSQISATFSPALDQPNFILFPVLPSVLFLITPAFFHKHFTEDLICPNDLSNVSALSYSSE